AAHPQRIDVAGLAVGGEIAPADAAEGDGGEIDVEVMLPELPPGSRIEAGHALLAGGPGADAAVGADPATDDDRRRAADQVGPPHQVLARRAPLRDQVDVGGDAVLVRTAPGGPVGPEEPGAGPGASDDGQHAREPLDRPRAPCSVESAEASHV